jgi:preprotein translocase subunit SecD
MTSLCNARSVVGPVFVAVLLALASCRSSEPHRKVTGPPAAQPPAGASRSALELRLVLDEPAPGSFELTDEAGKTLILSPDAVVTERDIVMAEVVHSATLGASSVSVHFSPEAAERLRKVSGENVGRRMAFVLDGKIFMAPFIRSTFASPVLIDSYYSREEAKRVAERLAP